MIQDAGSDVEIVDVEETDSLSGDRDSDSGDATEDEVTDKDELATFNAKLAEALRTHPGEEDLNAAESPSVDDEDMDDEQMEALDATLENVFRERVKAAKKTNQAKEAKQNVVLFKSRVLELLDIYVKREYSSGVCVKMIIPLLQAMRKTRSKDISQKLFDLLREYNSRYKLKDRLQGFVYASDGENLMTVLKEIHQEAIRGDDANLFHAACSIASRLVAKLLISNSELERQSVVKGITGVYAESQCSCLLDEKSKVRPGFFVDWANWITSNRKNLLAHSVATNNGHDAVEAS